MKSHIELMIHVDNSALKEKLHTEVTAMPGVSDSRLESNKPNILFVSYDPAVFDIRTIPAIGRKLGAVARLVGA